MNILERIAESPVVLDGAMGTMLYAKGVFINFCYDEVCLSAPTLIRDIHIEYVRAGANVIETNTFGANRIKLSRYGLGDKVTEINTKGASLALSVRDEFPENHVFVAGSVGPCLPVGTPLKPERSAELAAAFEEQIKALAEAGVDYIQLETFSNVNELQLAASVASTFKLPVLGSFMVDQKGDSALGRRIEDIIVALQNDPNIDLIGLNCGTGPAQAYDALVRALPLTDKPVVAMPNAGLPRDVDGRMIYMSNPEYFTEYAKKFIELGVRGIGGCCGTTPAHIAMMAKAVKTLSGVKQHLEIKTYAREQVNVDVKPVHEKSRLANKILRGEPITTIEILPPRSCDLQLMLSQARKIHTYGIDAINIPDGPRASSRVSPMIAALTIKREVGIEPILHYCCRDRNLIGMQADLMGGYAAGIENFLIITGDPPKLGNYPDATGVFDVDAIGLTQVTSNLNHGRDVGGSVVNPPTAIFIGVGANPCAVDMDREIERYLQKIEAGAEYAITQPVFDVEALFRFLDTVEQHGKSIPVVAGVWPLTSYKNAEFMKNEVPGVEVPDAILERMAPCTTREEGLVMGIQIAREIIEQIRDRVAGFQVSAPFGNVEMALRVLGKM